VLSLLNPEAHDALREAVWQRYGYETYEEEVRRFHKSSARIKIASSPARTAKSYSGAFDILPDIIIHGWLLEMSKAGQLNDADGNPHVIESQRGWVVCPNYDLAKEFDYLYRQLIERGPSLNWGYEITRAKKNANQGDMEIILCWGKNQRGEDVESIIEVRTSANEKSLQSEELDWVILSEAAEIDEKVWKTYISSRFTRAILPTTPKVGAGWLLDMIESADEHPELRIDAFNFTVRANPEYKCDRFWAAHSKAELDILGEIVTIPADVDEPPSEKNGHDCFDAVTGCEAAKDDGFAEQFLGHWTLKEGRVVPLREKVGPKGQPPHVIHDDRTWFKHADLHISMDYGFSDGCVVGFWLVGPNQIVLRRSIYKKGMVPDDVVTESRAMVEWFESRFDCENMLKRVVGDPKKPEVAELFRRRGLHVWNIDKKAQTDRAAGKMELMNALKTDPAINEPSLLVHADNIEVIAEWKKLRENPKARSEDSATAFIGADHAYDMARYYVMSRPINQVSTYVKPVTELERIRQGILRKRKTDEWRRKQSMTGRRRVGGLR
jgi:hypothetical protein